jgi:serine O-acetyltransferase
VTAAFLQLLAADVRRHYRPPRATTWGVLAAIGTCPGLQAVLVYRLGKWLQSARSPVVTWPLIPPGWLLYWLAAAFIRAAYDIHLAISAELGAGFFVGHFGGVRVYRCRMGANCGVGQHTKVGRPDDRVGPDIGESVWIGAHAKIFGTVKIGDRATIAPGARVMKNVPARTLIIGDPGRSLGYYDSTRILPPN